MAYNLDYESDHYCPVYEKVVCADICYESLMALSRAVKVSSVPELSEVRDIENARKVCRKCPYSDLSGGIDEWDGNLD